MTTNDHSNSNKRLCIRGAWIAATEHAPENYKARVTFLHAFKIWPTRQRSK